MHSLKPMFVLLGMLGTLVCLQCFSISQQDYTRLIHNECFQRSLTDNKELILGQNEPVGLSLDNLISLIEKVEVSNPNLRPDQIIKLLLKR